MTLQKLLDRPISLQLSVNYRSSPDILELANTVLGEETVKLQAHKNGGKPPLFLLPDDCSHEAAMITELIQKSSVPLQNQCILTRTGNYARPLIENLVRQKIPLNLQGELLLLYDQPKVKPMMAHLRMMAGRQKKGDLRPILKMLKIHPRKYHAILTKEGKNGRAWERSGSILHP